MGHKGHCCDIHGCKYGDEDCPVAYGNMKQDGPCEQCGLDWEGYYTSPDGITPGPPQLTLREDTKNLVHRVMRKTGCYDPETVINGAVTFLLEGLSELENYEDADKS